MVGFSLNLNSFLEEQDCRTEPVIIGDLQPGFV